MQRKRPAQGHGTKLARPRPRPEATSVRGPVPARSPGRRGVCMRLPFRLESCRAALALSIEMKGNELQRDAERGAE